LILLILLSFILASPIVQSRLAKYASGYLSDKLHTEVSIDNVSIYFLDRFSLKGILIKDQNQDTLLYIKEIDLRLIQKDITNKTIEFSKIELDHPYANIHLNNNNEFNYQFIIDAFSPDEEQNREANGSWQLRCKQFQLVDGVCTYLDETYDYETKGIDYWDILGDNLHIKASDLSFANDTIRANVSYLHLHERSGFVIDTLSGRVQFAPGEITTKDFRLVTGETDIHADAQLLFNKAGDFAYYIDSVQMIVEAYPSILNLKDIGYFAPVLFEMDNEIRFTTIAKGTVSNFKAKKLNFAIGRNTQFRGKIRMTGLPDVEETFTQLKIKEFYSSIRDIEKFRIPIESKQIDFPSIVEKIGNIAIKGNFTGFYNDFVSFARYSTDIGSFSTDIKLSLNDQDIVEYNGKIKGYNVAAGKWLDVQDRINNLDLNLRVQGNGLDFNKMNIDIDGEVNNIGVNGNTIQNIDIKGKLEEKKFSGNLNVDDELLAFDFDGLLDFSDDIPKYKFTSKVKHIDLKEFKIFPNDSTSILTTNIDINALGKKLNDIQGRISFNNTLLHKNTDTFKLGDIHISLTKDKDNYRIIKLLSPVAEANIEGRIIVNQLWNDIRQVSSHYLPYLQNEQIKADLTDNQDFIFRFDIKKPDILARITGNTQIYSSPISGNGEFANFLNYFTFNMHTKHIIYEGKKLIKPELRFKPDSNTMTVHFDANSLMLTDTLSIDKLSTDIYIKNDSLNYQINWRSAKEWNHDYAKITGLFHLDTSVFENIIYPYSKLVMQSHQWEIHPDNRFQIDHSRYIFHNLTFSEDKQKISLNGALSNSLKDTLFIAMENLNIQNFENIYQSYDLDFAGSANGVIKLSKSDSSTQFLINAGIDSLIFNDDLLGDTHINTYWNDTSESMNIKLGIVTRGNIGKNETVLIEGDYYPNLKSNNFDFDIKLKNYKLRSLQPFISIFSSGVGGFASGKLRFTGTNEKPYLLGEIKLKRVKLKIDYTNTEYYFADKIVFDTNNIHFDSIQITDTENNFAIVNGYFTHNYFEDFKYHIDVSTDKLLGINTDINQNEYFYGKALVNGGISIDGDLNKVNLNIQAAPLKETKITLPINSNLDLIENNYIVFVSPDDSCTLAGELTPPSSSSVTVNTKLNLNNKADVELIMPYDMGSITANGGGELEIDYNESGELSLMGEYIIEEGNYLMNLQSILNRVFTVLPGSKITWTGDPYNAAIDIKAAYDLRARLGEYAPIEDSSTVVPVQCVISLGNSLVEPSIHFGINFPDLNEDVKQTIYSRLDTTNQALMSRQVISLLVLHSFNYTSGSTYSLEANTFALFTNQINSWLSGLSDRFDIGIKYRPGDNISEDELGVMLSTQLWNDRVTIKGNLGVKNKSSAERSDNFIGEGEIELKLTQDGRLRLKAFNTSNNDYLFQDYSRYTQGVGIFYQREFDKIKELFQKKADDDKK
jgi:hypothetical protein